MKEVLVIEDDRNLSQLFVAILSLAGFEVDVAYSGHDGLVCLEQSVPDAIILDMYLPGMSGRTIYQLLEERQQADRVLICSADVDLVEEFKSKGANAICKPIGSIHDLTAMIARIAAHADAVEAS